MKSDIVPIMYLNTYFISNNNGTQNRFGLLKKYQYLLLFFKVTTGRIGFDSFQKLHTQQLNHYITKLLAMWMAKGANMLECGRNRYVVSCKSATFVCTVASDRWQTVARLYVT